jgi:3-hydroxymyristoyl/3-hydroxydecanoyl-(acyl carrier protein) dehydratase
MWVFEGKVKVDGRVVAEAEVMANLLAGSDVGGL